MPKYVPRAGSVIAGQSGALAQPLLSLGNYPLKPSRSPSCLGMGLCPKAAVAHLPAFGLIHPMGPGPLGPCSFLSCHCQ